MTVMTTRGIEFPNGMPQVMGSRVYKDFPIKTTHPMHMSPSPQPLNPERVTEGFAGALNNALAKVEQLDNHSQHLITQAVYDPDRVDAHTLIVAGEKARFALNLTKNLADGFIRGYRELTNPR